MLPSGLVTRYELLDRIGVGGMAEIFRGKAVAAGGFEKPVAIKRILPHLSQDPRFVELLIAEAKILSLLKHRNIVQIFDVGLGDDGKYFLVMEYVDGKDLGAIQRTLETRRRKLPFDLALHVAAEMCEALEHAHTARAPDGRPMTLVHRDVSPSNVLLSRAGEVKLTDFGIAKRAEQEQTGHGAVRGKFAYISPEQARNEHIDPRSDVFAVGILMWELICNRRLFSGMSDMDALRAVREAQVQRPAEIDPRLSPEIDQLVMAALSRDFKRRPTAGELGAKLRAMRYAMEVTVGDPATELAKIIDTADEVERQSQHNIQDRASGFELERGSRGSMQIDPNEMTVIRIRTADAFSMRDMGQAKAVIERFEEEETRLAQLSGDQLRMLRNRSPRDSADLLSPPPARSRRETDEATVARSPLDGDIITPPTNDALVPPNQLPPNQHLESGEHTRLVAPRDRRTPAPQRVASRERSESRSERSAERPERSDRKERPKSRDRRTPVPERVLPRPTSAVPPPAPPPRTQEMTGAPPAISASMAVPAPRGSISQDPIGWQGNSPYPAPLISHAQPPPPPLPTPYPLGPGAYAGWGSSPQIPRPSQPVMPMPPPRKQPLALWMLIAGALVMAGLAFAVTRACLGTTHPSTTETDK